MNNEMKPTSNLTIFQQTLSTFAEKMGKSGATRELKKTGGGSTTSEVFKNMRAEVEKADKGDLQTLNQLKQKYDEIKAREPQDSSKSSVLYKTNQFSKMCFSKSYTREVVKARREFDQLGEAIQKKLQELEHKSTPAQKNEQLPKVQTSLRSFAGVVGQPGATTSLKEDYNAKSTKDVFDQMLATLNNAKPEPDLETLLNLKATMDAIAEKEILQKPGSSVLHRTTSIHKKKQIASTRSSFNALNAAIKAKIAGIVGVTKIEKPDIKTIKESLVAFNENPEKTRLSLQAQFGVNSMKGVFEKMKTILEEQEVSDKDSTDLSEIYDLLYSIGSKEMAARETDSSFIFKPDGIVLRSETRTAFQELTDIVTRKCEDVDKLVEIQKELPIRREKDNINEVTLREGKSKLKFTIAAETRPAEQLVNVEQPDRTTIEEKTESKDVPLDPEIVQLLQNADISEYLEVATATFNRLDSDFEKLEFLDNVMGGLELTLMKQLKKDSVGGDNRIPLMIYLVSKMDISPDLLNLEVKVKSKQQMAAYDREKATQQNLIKTAQRSEDKWKKLGSLLYLLTNIESAMSYIVQKGTSE